MPSSPGTLWRRVGLRIGCAMLVLSALLLLYGPAHVSFQLDRETNQELHSTVTAALLVMLGLPPDRPRATALDRPAAFARARRVSAAWDRSAARAPGFAPRTLFRPFAIFVLLLLAIDFIVEGQLGKVISYYGSVGLLEEQALFRKDEGGSRFYLVNILVLTLAPFLSMVLLCEPFAPERGAPAPSSGSRSRSSCSPSSRPCRSRRPRSTCSGLPGLLADPLERGTPASRAGGAGGVPAGDDSALAGGVSGHRARRPAVLLLLPA